MAYWYTPRFTQLSSPPPPPSLPALAQEKRGGEVVCVAEKDNVVFFVQDWALVDNSNE